MSHYKFYKVADNLETYIDLGFQENATQNLDKITCKCGLTAIANSLLAPSESPHYANLLSSKNGGVANV